MARLTPRRAAGAGDPLEPLDHVRGEPVLRQRGQRLGGEADVADGLDVEQPHQVRLEGAPRHVGDVAAGHDHVAHAGVLLEVRDVRLVPINWLECQLQLLDRGGRVADEVHPGAVSAVLRTRGE
jgi:hypothetical protein